MLKSGERQVATRREDVRADHTARYDWAAAQLPANSYVIDLGCGIGYGARILADAGHRVFAVDVDAETIAHARAHFAHPNIKFVCGDLTKVELPEADAATCFEVIEHIANPLPVLIRACEAASTLFASVPNEDSFPWKPEYTFHHRHYRLSDFTGLLVRAGFSASWLGGQFDQHSPVESNISKVRTLVATATPAEANASTEAGFYRLTNQERARYGKIEPKQPRPPVAKDEKTGPGHVVILGLGPSVEQYVDLTKRLGGRKAFADEVWAINGLGDIVQCDLVFHMDDIRVQMLRAEAKPQSNIAVMVDWLRTTKTPVMTSRAHPDFPAMTEFPLQNVINGLGYAYFNGTAAYAVAYAIYRGATKISLFGCDFSYEHSHHAEKGRGCVEFWLGVAAAKGIQLGFADQTSLMDTIDEPKDPTVLNVYGYDFDHVRVETVDGLAKIRFEPRADPPTADAIEDRYDHSKPTAPSALLAKA